MGIVTVEEITGWIGAYMWTLFRVTALIAAAPVLGSRTIPLKIKLGLSLALTLIIVPLLPAPPAIEPLSANGILIIIHQIIIGTAMGLTIKMVFTMFIVGGQVIAYQMGLGFSQMVDPSSGTQVPVISQFYIIVVTLLFFTLNGHIALIELLFESFVLLPIGPQGISRAGYWLLIEWSQQMFSGGVKIALPAVGSILMINFTFGVVTRSAPSFNIFSVGFPITIMMGFFIMAATLSNVVPQFSQFFYSAIETAREILEVR